MAGNAKELVADLETFRRTRRAVSASSRSQMAIPYAIARGDGYWLDTQEYVMLALGSIVIWRIPHTHSVPHKFFTAGKRTVDTPKNLIDVKDLISLASSSSSNTQRESTVPYYALLTTDIWGTFGSGVTKGAVITALKNDGVTKFADLDGLSVERGRGGNPGALTFDSKYALLLGTDKGWTTLDKDIMKFCEVARSTASG